MKTIVAVSIAVLAFSSPASAACSTSAMAGTWRIVSESGTCDATVNTAGYISGGCRSGRLSATSACKVTGKLRGYAFEGRTEAIGTKSSLKPNHLLAYGSAFGGIAGYRR